MSFGSNLAGTNQNIDLLNTIYGEFKLLRDETGIFRSCATEMKLKPQEGVSKNIVNYSRVTAYNLADGVDMAQAQALADTATSYTPGEVGVQVVLSGSAMRRAPDADLLRRTGRMLNAAYDLKEDQDGGLQLVNFTPIMGAAGATLGPGEYEGAIARLMLGNNRANPEPPPTPYFLVDHPLKLMIIAMRLIGVADTGVGTTPYTPATVSTGKAIGPVGAGALSNELLKMGLNALGTFFGAVVKRSANLLPNSSDDVSGGAFSREGLIYVSELEPRLDADTSDKSMRGAVELNLWGSFVWGLYRSGAYGCEILGAAVMPSAS